MIINIVNCKYEKMIELSETLSRNDYYQKHEDGLIFSFDKLDFIEPTGAIMFWAIIDKLKSKEYTFSLKTLDKESSGPISYGLNIGFFQMIGLSTNTQFKANGRTYISPTKVNLNELYERLRKKHENTETYFDDIASFLVETNLKFTDYKENTLVKSLIEYSIREMVRNIFDHSETDEYNYSSQYYEKDKRVEIVISDNGVGLRETVPFDMEYKWFNEISDRDAILRAIIPGITAKSNHSYASETHKNTGFGLNIVKRIATHTGGDLTIVSGTLAMSFHNKRHIERICDFTGTIIRISMYLDKLNDIIFDEIINDAKEEALALGIEIDPSSASSSLNNKKRN
ncbi:ATP-binding protein [Salipaludibacillus daqingensis]|uniref:ATP-binding protein n=1 Tax=Salipaludibacillus daqingensis TaxID=3041001 RepID=UPI0024765973|nr:ATP-binding protein [Salipaludibacillus daqingensis]